MGMTFASGRLVLAGSRAYDVGTVLVSSDGVRFDQVDIEGRSPSLLQSVTHAGDRFFAFSTLQGFASRDGLTWKPLAFGSAFLPNAVAYGGSVYLVAGNGGLRLSADAESWRALEIDCALESACVSDPDGNERNMLRTAAYSDGAFYVNSLKSTDGLSWQRNDGVTPVRHVGAHDLAWTEQGWVAWKAGAPPIILRVRDFPRDERGSVLNPGLLVEPRVVPSAPPPPAAVAFEPEAGSDCLASRCLELGGRLYISR